MSRAPVHLLSTGLRRRKPKRKVCTNERWLHMSSCNVGIMRTLQTVMATTLLFCVFLNHLHDRILTAESVVTNPAVLAILDAAFESMSTALVFFLCLIVPPI